MPRKPRVVATGDEGQDAQPVQAATKPPGVSDEAWAIGGILGNLALAIALLDVVNGVREPESDREILALMDAARKLEARSYKRHRTLVATMGQKIAAAKEENRTHLVMLDILRDIEQYGRGHLAHLNGQSPLSSIVNQSITGMVGGTVGGSGDAAVDALIAQNTEPRD